MALHYTVEEYLVAGRPVRRVRVVAAAPTAPLSPPVRGLSYVINEAAAYPARYRREETPRLNALYGVA